MGRFDGWVCCSSDQRNFIRPLPRHTHLLALDADRMMSASYCPIEDLSSSGDMPSLVVTLPNARSRSKPVRAGVNCQCSAAVLLVLHGSRLYSRALSRHDLLRKQK